MRQNVPLHIRAGSLLPRAVRMNLAAAEVQISLLPAQLADMVGIPEQTAAVGSHNAAVVEDKEGLEGLEGLPVDSMDWT